MTQPVRLLVVEVGQGARLQVQAVGNGLRYEWCKKMEGELASAVVYVRVSE